MSELVVGSLKGLAANGFKIEVASGSKVVQPGSILQVVSTTKTDTFSTTSATYTDITGLSATITPTSASSKILVLAYTVLSHSLDFRGVHVQLVRDSTAIFIGDAGGASQFRASGGGEIFQYVTWAYSPIHLDSPNTTSALTYKVQINRGSEGTAFLGRSGTDVNNANRSRTPASITLMEVAG